MPRLPLVLALIAASCSAPPACQPGTGTPVEIFTLYFGQSIAGRGDVTPEAWRAFQADTITANLPNGYTVADANGAWMNPATRRTIQEPTKVLTVALPASTANRAAVDRIRFEYQARFRQQLVGMAIQQGCGVF